MKQVRIRGKSISPDDLIAIKTIMDQHPLEGRGSLSRRICQHFHWVQPNGQLQDVACREILLRLERLGLIRLPPRMYVHTRRYNAGRLHMELALEEVPPEPIQGRLGEFSDVRLVKVLNQKESNRWNALIARYHYLGYKPMVGRSMKYWIYLEDKEVGLLGWGSPSWKLGSRDRWIGWDAVTREKNLQGIANNTRFLIFDWVKVKYLASHILSVAARQVPREWWERYGVKLWLFETFVDSGRYKGTCYRAANWRFLGQSKGSSKSGNSYQWHGQVKDIYVYPLGKDFREKLLEP